MSANPFSLQEDRNGECPDMVNIKSSDEDLITKIAWLYYKEGLNQNDIAKRLRISRQRVGPSLH
jgi:DNA-binding transcriptional regulator LsrR (DeoR family)